ncbi:MAG: LysR family transcriptional regulator [Spirochaetales bacterium]|nr:LysR family transcriptional regulator [Spirochaetales bacterium]
MGELERIHLEIVRAVHEKGSLTAAGEALHLTQSALSHSIKKLETLLGVSLWHRDGRALKFTEAGAWLLASAQRLLPSWEQLEERLTQFGRGERGTFKIGTECHPCYKWLLKITPDFLREWPEADLDVRQKFQFGGLGALFQREIDLLLTPDPLFKPGLSFQAVVDYEAVAVVGCEHPWQSCEYVEPLQFAREVLYTYPVDTDRLDIFTGFLTPSGVSPRRHQLVESTEILLQLIADGRGVGTLPRWLVEEYSREYPVTGVRLGEQGVFKQIYAGFRDGEQNLPYAQTFLELSQRRRG